MTGLTGGDATRMNDYIQAGDFLSGETILQAVQNAIAVNEVNAKMGLICATPTAGSAGVVSGVLMAVRDRLQLSRSQQIDFLFCRSLRTSHCEQCFDIRSRRRLSSRGWFCQCHGSSSPRLC